MLSFGAIGCSLATGRIEELPSTTVPTLSFETTALSLTEGTTNQVKISLSEVRKVDTVAELKLLTIDNVLAGRFSNFPSTVTIPAGAVETTFALAVTNDAIHQGTQAVDITLKPVSGGVGTLTASIRVTVTDDEVVPTLSIANTTIAEDGFEAVFTVTLTGAHRSSINVSWASSNGTADAGSDYTAAAGSLTFLPGEVSKEIRVPLLNDTVVDGSETFLVTLTSPTLVTISNAVGTATITDNDIRPTAVLTNVPDDTLNTNNVTILDVTVGPLMTVLAYRHKVVTTTSDCLVDTGYPMTEVDVATKITDDLNSFGPGPISLTLCVIGRDASGNWQLVTSATTATWTKP